MNHSYARYALIITLIAISAPVAAQGPTADEASDALRKAVEFFRGTVSTEGGYLWRYSADLKTREGEGKADDQTIWVQPPGTPSVGQALLHAYRRTGDDYYLQCARDAAMALVHGQLESGGWDYRIHFDDRESAYNRRLAPGDGRNISTLDDNVTQSALRLLMDIDETLDFKDEAIHGAVIYGLDKLVATQYPNGAWPQRFSGAPDPEKYPVKKASYPESWSRTHPNEKYTDYYTFNDNTIADTIDLLFDASEVYEEKRYRDAAVKAGDFILLAQMPEPQPAWAQQYNADMHPAWARRFEPPAITGGESQGVMRTLIAIYRRTGDAKYLDAAERAVNYLKTVALDDGRMARFYELKTDTPLYFTKEYELTYSDADMPTHYAFKTGNSLDGIATAIERARTEKPSPSRQDLGKVEPSDRLTQAASRAIESLDERGAWVEADRLRYHGDDDPTRKIIQSSTFSANIRTLADYIASAQSL